MLPKWILSTITYWKSVLAFLTIMGAMTVFRMDDTDHGMRAAVFACAASGMLFIGLLPGIGNRSHGQWLVFHMISTILIKLGGASLAMLAGIFWILEEADGRNVSILLSVPIFVGTMMAALTVFAVIQVVLLPPKVGND